MCKVRVIVPVCLPFLTTVRVMTSNTNPLDWDYSSSRAVAGRPAAEDCTSLACLPVSLAVCLHSGPHTGSMTSSTRDVKVTHNTSLCLQLCYGISLPSFFVCFHECFFPLPAPVTSVNHKSSFSCVVLRLPVCLFIFFVFIECVCEK